MTVVYDPYSPEIQADPYPIYRRLRDEAPVYYNERLKFWALSRFEDVWSGHIDWQTYSSSHGPIIEDLDIDFSILGMDPPPHTRLRNLVSKGFTPRRVSALEPEIRRIAEGFLDPLHGAGRCDIVGDFSGMFPLDVISGLVGVAREDREHLRNLFDATPERDPATGAPTERALAAITETRALFADLVEKRRREPREDLISVITNGEFDDGERLRQLDDEEIFDFLFVVAGAGGETTTRLIAHGTYLLAQHPDQRELLLREPERIPVAVEEMLRYLAPSQYQGRWTLRDAHLHGQTIPAGQRVILITGAACRDEREFPEPDRFDVTRKTDRQVYFGLGHHVCLGKSLARLEARIAFEEILARFPNYEIIPESIERTQASNTQGMSRLEITW